MIERKIAKKTAESLVRDWCRFLNADALGLMFLDLPAGRLTPLVYVPGADTLFWESSCASGTAAAGAWLASASRKPLTMSLRQPGGVLEITASPDGTLLLKGTVSLVYEKTVSIEMPDTET